MHPTISCDLAHARIADLRRHAQRDALARAEPKDAVRLQRERWAPGSRPQAAGYAGNLHLGPCLRSPRWALQSPSSTRRS